jgi:hypothetical protein
VRSRYLRIARTWATVTALRVVGFVRGVTVAVVGVLLGTTYLIGRPVMIDAFGVAVMVVVFVAPFVVRRVPDQAYVAMGAVLGIALRH